MKKNLFKLILMTALCLMLCVAAMPFSVSAEETTTAAADAGATTAAATDQTTISIFGNPGSSSSGGAAVAVGSASGKAGDTVTVNVDLTQNPGVIAMALDVGYDEKQLELVNVNNSGVLNGFNSPSPSGSSGKYTLNWEDGLSDTNNNGTGTVATLTFKLKEDCDKATVTVSGKGHDKDVSSVSVSGSSGTITNTSPTTTTTTTKPTTTKPTTTKPAKTTTTKASGSGSSGSGSTRAATYAYTRSYNEGNTYPVDFEVPTTEAEEESSTDLLDLWESTTEYVWTEPSTEESTTELTEENEKTPMSKTKLILIVLMACFAIVGIAIIVSMVRKSKG